MGLTERANRRQNLLQVPYVVYEVGQNDDVEALVESDLVHVGPGKPQTRVIGGGEGDHLITEIDPEPVRWFNRGEQPSGTAAELDDPRTGSDEVLIDLGKTPVIVAALESAVRHCLCNASPVSLARVAILLGFVGHHDSSPLAGGTMRDP
jgi:hypothetical protein